jgi:hypothetical protein
VIFAGFLAGARFLAGNVGVYSHPSLQNGAVQFPVALGCGTGMRAGAVCHIGAISPRALAHSAFFILPSAFTECSRGQGFGGEGEGGARWGWGGVLLIY